MYHHLNDEVNYYIIFLMEYVANKFTIFIEINFGYKYN